MSVDTIGDFLTIIRNGVMAFKRKLKAPYSNIKNEIATILKDEGFIKDFLVETGEDGHKYLLISLKYFKGESVIHEIKRVSTPGRRIYNGVTKFKPVIDGLGISIITTNKGVISNKKARQLNVGGEIICTVW